jgi:predicted ATP-dependent endonuclease of OLD family
MTTKRTNVSSLSACPSIISQIRFKNFIHFNNFAWDKIGGLNVIIGENDTGKTNLLKLLYSTTKAWSIFTNNQKNNRDIPFNETLTDKLFNTFQPRPQGIGDLVNKKSGEKLDVEITYFAHGDNRQAINYKFASDAKKIKEYDRAIQPHKNGSFSSIFIPAEEVLTAFDAILSTRTEDNWMYGFDDTYTDLIKLLLIEAVPGKQKGPLTEAVQGLEMLVGGKISRTKDRSEKFVFSKKGNEKYSMSLTAEGVKKLGIYTMLIDNGQLRPGTVLFLDEPETELHPRAIVILGKMLHRFSQNGIQIFITTHSYFLLKQLELLARKNNESFQCCSLKSDGDKVAVEFSDLKEGMPDNPIVEVALKLLDDELDIP